VRARALFAATALGAVVLGGCTYQADETGPYRPAIVAASDDVTNGEQLYERDCAWCHASDGTGTQRGPDLVSGTNGPALTHFVLTTGRMPLDFPEQRSTRRAPAYSSRQIDAIVEHVAGFGGTGPGIPELDLADAEVSEGAALYAENCAACHGTTLVGGALIGGPPGAGGEVNAPGLRDSSPVEIAEAMLTGPGPMPVFAADAFTNEEIDAIVAYVVEVRGAVDRGGVPILHVGPVTEGAVAWILGLGALLVAARWIGTRTGEP
jgi:ubiquinol-cytochrome c reductase cytochrome c subunit